MSEERDRSDVDPPEGLIERVHRGEATLADQRRLAEWRRSSVANERTYRRTLRLLEALGSLARLDGRGIPSVGDIMTTPRPSLRKS